MTSIRIRHFSVTADCSNRRRLFDPCIEASLLPRDLSMTINHCYRSGYLSLWMLLLLSSLITEYVLIVRRLSTVRRHPSQTALSPWSLSRVRMRSYETLRHCVKTAKRVVVILSPFGSSVTLVFPKLNTLRNSDGIAHTGTLYTL